VYSKIFVFAIMGILFMSTVALQAVATPNENANDKAQNNAKFEIPKNAVEIAPGIFSLGTIESNGLILEGIMSLHHRNGHTGGPGGGDTSGEIECYSYSFGKPLQWREQENWIVNPSNTKGLTQTEVMVTLNAGIDEWELWAETGILGTGTSTTNTLEANTATPLDDVNEIYFADIRNSDGSPNFNILGMTITWAVVNGPPFARGIVEMDQVYNNNFDWSTDDNGVADKFDLGSTATHEWGHGVGMGHAPAVEECILETMYPFGGPNDTDGRDLHDGDIAGIQKLY